MLDSILGVENEALENSRVGFAQRSFIENMPVGHNRFLCSTRTKFKNKPEVEI
jgi:hypothetical protein